MMFKLDGLHVINTTCYQALSSVNKERKINHIQAIVKVRSNEKPLALCVYCDQLNMNQPAI